MKIKAKLPFEFLTWKNHSSPLETVTSSSEVFVATVGFLPVTDCQRATLVSDSREDGR